MSDERGREVQVTFAEGVRDDVTGLAANSTAGDKIGESEVEALAASRSYWSNAGRTLISVS